VSGHGERTGVRVPTIRIAQGSSPAPIVMCMAE